MKENSNALSVIMVEIYIGAAGARLTLARNWLRSLLALNIDLPELVWQIRRGIVFDYKITSVIWTDINAAFFYATWRS